MNDKKLISIVTPCYNEEDNIEEIQRLVKAVFAQIPQYNYEHIFIDNASTDTTVVKLEAMAEVDRNVKVIVNNRNFGPVRSPFYGLLQATGDTVILLVADLQDPPKMIIDFLTKWEEGFKVVIGVKESSEESAMMFAIRKIYYSFVTGVSEVKLVKNYTGFGMYDRKVIECLRNMKDPYPYFRGMVSYLGFNTHQILYRQPVRKRGISKYNFYALYDLAMLGITNHSKVPLRMITMLGFFMSIISLFIAVIHVFLKLIFWDQSAVGITSIIISIFFFSSIQLFFMGLIGEYIASIHTHLLNRPLVIEKRRINF
jgi:polyisoprenyl-phosphate glycosyltransferase